MSKISRLPAIPVITHDPFFSLWCMGKHPAADHTRHWASIAKPLWGGCIIDGITTRFFGRGGRQMMKCVDTDITPLSTKFVFEALGVRLTVKFTSPLLLDDMDIMSTPISYVQFATESIDGKVDNMGTRISAIENEPIQNFSHYKRLILGHVITAVITAVCSGILALIMKG